MFAIEENTFASRLRWLRERHLGVGLVEFADKVNSSKGYISDLERAVKKNPSTEFIEKVCNAAGVSQSWLENGLGEPFPNTRYATASDAPGVYRAVFRLSAISTLSLERFYDILTEDLKTAETTRRKELLESITALNEEQDRRLHAAIKHDEAALERKRSAIGKGSLAVATEALQRDAEGSAPSQKAASSSDKSASPNLPSPSSPGPRRTPPDRAPK
jgi:transcriptional regulator with XRE-family HTH domain